LIILDTNVVSEPIRPRSNPAILQWLDCQVAETLYLTATSLAELSAGIEALPPGKRKVGLAAGLDTLLQRLFGERILAFDREAALHYAAMRGRARAAGRTISFADGQIAAIAMQHGFSVATRDTEPFLAVGVPVIDPWVEHASAR
jgi:predicted nucleic acid-binding protein